MKCWHLAGVWANKAIRCCNNCCLPPPPPQVEFAFLLKCQGMLGAPLRPSGEPAAGGGANGAVEASK